MRLSLIGLALAGSLIGGSTALVQPAFAAKHDFAPPMCVQHGAHGGLTYRPCRVSHHHNHPAHPPVKPQPY
jgi:hypothetical protein